MANATSSLAKADAKTYTASGGSNAGAASAVSNSTKGTTADDHQAATAGVASDANATRILAPGGGSIDHPPPLFQFSQDELERQRRARDDQQRERESMYAQMQAIVQRQTGIDQPMSLHQTVLQAAAAHQTARPSTAGLMRTASSASTGSLHSRGMAAQSTPLHMLQSGSTPALDTRVGSGTGAWMGARSSSSSSLSNPSLGRGSSSSGTVKKGSTVRPSSAHAAARRSALLTNAVATSLHAAIEAHYNGAEDAGSESVPVGASSDRRPMSAALLRSSSHKQLQHEQSAYISPAYVLAPSRDLPSALVRSGGFAVPTPFGRAPLQAIAAGPPLELAHLHALDQSLTAHPPSFSSSTAEDSSAAAPSNAASPYAHRVTGRGPLSREFLPVRQRPALSLSASASAPFLNLDSRADANASAPALTPATAASIIPMLAPVSPTSKSASMAAAWWPPVPALLASGRGAGVAVHQSAAAALATTRKQQQLQTRPLSGTRR
jgi:hypothetical protein